VIIKVDPELGKRFPDLKTLSLQIKGVTVKKKNPELEKFKAEVMNQIKDSYTLDTVKDHPTFRTYRDFYWSIKIDPTKTRPAAEALVRRILAGKHLPCVNTLVDAYNLASIKSGIALATFDADKLTGELEMRFAEKGEEFIGIGMEKPMVLNGGEIVVSDREKLVAIYPYRDADNTKVTETTKNVTIVVCGVPGIPEEALENARSLAVEYVTRFCGGET